MDKMNIFGSASSTKKASAPVQRKHQDSLFSKLYSEKNTLLDLYQTLHAEDVTVTEDQINIVTLTNTFIAGRYNDVAFTVDDRLIVLVEHQSTVNYNMPLRMLLYVSNEYETLLNDYKEQLFGRKRIPLPKPEFYIVYTGKEKIEPVMKLSDAFSSNDEFCLDLHVKILTDAPRSKTLGGYFEFINFVSENLRDGKISVDAVDKFIRDYQGSCLFKDFLCKLNSMEVSKMVNLEYDYEAEKRAIAKENREEGRAEIIVKLLKKGNTPEQVSDLLDLSLEEIIQIKDKM